MINLINRANEAHYYSLNRADEDKTKHIQTERTRKNMQRTVFPTRLQMADESEFGDKEVHDQFKIAA